jgi:hypothetical protein
MNKSTALVRRHGRLMGGLLARRRGRNEMTLLLPNECRQCAPGAVSKDQTTPCFRRFSSTDTNVSRFSTPQTRVGKTLDFLQEETNQLLKVLDGSEKSKRPVTSQYCYHLLESWMIQARDHQQLDAARQAQEVLHHLESVSSTALAPTSLFYDMVLQAHALCDGGRPAAEAAQSLLQHMLQNEKAAAAPTAKTFNIVINAWAKSQVTDAGKEAEKIFQMMETYHREQGKNQQSTAPNVRTLTGVMDAWANSGHHDASSRIMVILQHAVGKYNKANPAESSMPLDLVVFHTVIRALTRTERNRQGAEKAEEVLRMLNELNNETNDENHRLAPTTQIYSLILHAWAQCEAQEHKGDAARRAEDVLGYMVQLYRKGLDVKPNYRSFTTCIAAWANCAQVEPNAPERAERLLQTLLDFYQETQDADLKPDTTAGNAVLTAWSRSKRPDAPQRTEQALTNLKEFATPDLISYNCLLHAHGVAGNATEALALLEWLETLAGQDQPELLPDVVSYNSVIHALAKSKSREAAVQAEDLLARMEELAVSYPNVRPTNVTYTSVVNAWFHSSDPSPASHAYAMFQKLLAAHQADPENRDLKPDLFIFVAVLQACAKEQEKQSAALEMASNVFDQLIHHSPSVRPNELVFVSMMEACNHLAYTEKEWIELVQPVFERCCRAGCVSRRVLGVVRRKISSETLQQILGTVDTNSLPPQWSRSIPRRHRP